MQKKKLKKRRAEKRKNRKGFRESCKDSWAKVRAKWQNYKQRKAYTKLKKKNRKEYNRMNEESHQERFQLARSISYSATEMMEKHYAGKASIVAGMNCLQQMQMHKNNVEKLRETQEACSNRHKYFKQSVKRGDIEYVDILEEKTRRDLLKLMSQKFNGRVELVALLAKSFDAKMECSIRGGSIAGSFLIGGSTQYYHLKCRSALGRRNLYVAPGVNLGFGVGELLATTYQNISKKMILLKNLIQYLFLITA